MPRVTRSLPGTTLYTSLPPNTCLINHERFVVVELQRPWISRWGSTWWGEVLGEEARSPGDSEPLRKGHTSLGRGALNFQRPRDREVQGHRTRIPKAGYVPTNLGVTLYIQGIVKLLFSAETKSSFTRTSEEHLLPLQEILVDT